jgi:hypothetical protein
VYQDDVRPVYSNSSPTAEVQTAMAGPRPPFQAPFPCGQAWDASTYSNHKPNPNSVDLAQRDEDGNNLSKGEPVLASADGTVLFVGTQCEENRVRLITATDG